jgi:putative phage-type endonuclease
MRRLREVAPDPKNQFPRINRNQFMNYPECKLIDCDQRSDEWFAARKGCLTASQFGAWLTKTDKTSTKARATAAGAILAELAGYPDPRVFENDDIKRGIEQEPEAIQEFSRLTGLLVDPIGFARSKHGLFGCSPDGLILSTSEGLEVKCPRASKLIQYHQHGVLPDEYVHQVHGSMAVTGARAWHFFAYHRGLPSFHIRVERTALTNDMAEGLKSFSNYLQTVSADMQKLAEEQKA